MKPNHDDHGIDKHAFNIALGRRLYALRVKHKKSQSYIGEKLGVSYQQIYKYETGETQISPSQLLAYTKLFNVSLSYLYGITNQSGEGFNYIQDIENLPCNIRSTLFELARQISNSCNKKS